MNEHKIQVQILAPAPGFAIVEVSGPLNVANVNELRSKLMAAYADAKKITIDLSGVTEIDVAGLQLLCASHRSSISEEKAFDVVGHNHAVIQEMAYASGHLRTCGCLVDVNKTCIWSGGDEWQNAF